MIKNSIFPWRVLRDMQLLLEKDSMKGGFRFPIDISEEKAEEALKEYYQFQKFIDAVKRIT